MGLNIGFIPYPSNSCLHYLGIWRPKSSLLESGIYIKQKQDVQPLKQYKHILKECEIFSRAQDFQSLLSIKADPGIHKKKNPLGDHIYNYFMYFLHSAEGACLHTYLIQAKDASTARV